MEDNVSKKIAYPLLAVFIAVFLVVSAMYFMDQAEEERALEEERMEEEARETGLSPTRDGRVVTQEGEEVRYDVEPGSPDAPQQSSPIGEGEIPQDSINILATRDGGYVPSEFTVRSGDLVTLSVTAGDERVYVFKFRDPSLSAVAIGVGPGETRSIRFNAPSSGEYEFYCDVPGCGLIGKMIVR